MPNRIIKESICTSDTIDSLTWFEECFFTRLWTACDDFGRFDARIKILRGRLFPLKDDVSDADIENVLDRLQQLGSICVYTVEGKPYLQIVHWDDHQSIRSKRSKYPAPADASENSAEPKNGDFSLSESTCKQMQANDFNCKQMQANVPVIQSVSESISESVSEYKQPKAPAPQAADKDTAVKRGRFGWVKLSENELADLNSRFDPQEVLRSIGYIDELSEQTNNRNGWSNWALVVARCAENGWGRRRKPLEKPEKSPDALPEPRGPTTQDIDRMKRILEELG